MHRKHTGLILSFVLAATFPLMGVDCDPEETTCETPSVPTTDGYYDRFEGSGFDNSCGSDGDCMVGGCSGEVCAAESVFTTCEALPYGPTGSCGCVMGECLWAVDTCGECTVDADCELFSNYCDGCACEALPLGSPPPACGGTTVACLVDPCLNHVSICNAGYCEAANLP